MCERDYAAIVLLLDTGMRVGELASITRGSITPRGIVVSGKTGDRMIPVTPDVLDLVSAQGEDELVWCSMNGGSQLTTSGLQQIVRRNMRLAGFRPPKLGPHTLRHTFALQYLLNGGDFSTLQTILGHRKVQSTMIYASMNMTLRRPAASQVLADGAVFNSRLANVVLNVQHRATPSSADRPASGGSSKIQATTCFLHCVASIDHNVATKFSV